MKWRSWIYGQYSFAFRAFPEAEVFFIRQNFSKIHGHLVLLASDRWKGIGYEAMPVPAQDEVSLRAVVVDQARRVRAGINNGGRTAVAYGKRGEREFYVVVMAKDLQINDTLVFQDTHTVLPGNG